MDPLFFFKDFRFLDFEIISLNSFDSLENNNDLDAYITFDMLLFIIIWQLVNFIP